MSLGVSSVLAVALMASPPPPQATATVVIAPNVQATEISVLTYNVRGLPWPIARGRGKALKTIGEELARMRQEGRQPSIVLIQEGFRGEVADLVRASGYRYSAQGPRRHDRPAEPLSPAARAFGLARYVTSGEGWGKLTSAGLYVLSDLPIVDIQRAAYRECAGWDCLANKGVMLVRVQLADAPVQVDIVNTHMNAMGASHVPKSRWLAAHKLQTDRFLQFVKDNLRGGPLLIGGDFNVRNSPERYYYQADARPYKVVSEYCRQAAAGCADAVAPDMPEPWLQSQDLQAFASGGGVEVQPEAAKALFRSAESGGRLSDHDGYLVRYRLSWRPGDLAPVAVAAGTTATQATWVSASQ